MIRDEGRDLRVAAQAELAAVIRALAHAAGSLVIDGMGVGSFYAEARDVENRLIELRRKVREKAGLPN